jgi:hypothetical protein
LTLLADPEHIRQHLDDFGPDTWGTPLEARNLDWEVLVASDILLCKSVHSPAFVPSFDDHRTLCWNL